MGDKNKVLTWDAFQSLGNPDNAPDEIEEKGAANFKIALKVHYEKKGRGGKEAIIIRGFEEEDGHDINELCKEIKVKLGTGGSAKDFEIVVQGSNREKVMEILAAKGFKNVKRVGG